MITQKQRKKLELLISDLAAAEIEDSWKGSQLPMERLEIEVELIRARNNLRGFLNDITEPR